MKRVCELSDLTGRRSVRFELTQTKGRFGYGPREGFVVAGADGAPRAYVNICPHRGQPVDLGDGRLFLADGHLECQAHGAVFDPATGACVRGPCEGVGLRELPAEVRGSAVFAGELWPAASDDGGED